MSWTARTKEVDRVRGTTSVAPEEVAASAQGGARPREAAANAQLAEALAELERARARATELQRCLEQIYGKRRRLVEEAQGRIHEIRTHLRHHQDHDREREQEQQPPTGGTPSSSSPS